MALYRVSGVDQGKTVEVDQQFAGVSFIRFVNKNFFQLQDLFRKHPDIVQSKVKPYCEANGLDFRIIETILNGKG